MQRLTLVAPSIFEMVILPTAKIATYEILERAGVLKKVSKNRILFNSIATAPAGSTKDNVVNLDTERVEVDVTFSADKGDRKYGEESGEADAPALSVHWFDQQDKKVTFYDPISSITIQGHGTAYTVTMDTRLFIKGVSEAMEMVASLQSVLQDNTILFDLEYTQLLPPNLMTWLYQLYKFGDNEPTEFIQYLSEWSGNRITRVLNRHQSDDVALGVNKVKKGVTLSCEFNSAIEPVNGGKSPDLYQLTLNTSFTLFVDTRYSLFYPHCINNKNLPKDMLLVEKPQKRGGATYDYFSLTDYLDMIRQNKALLRRPAPFHIPWYDEWAVPLHSHPPKYRPIVIAHFTLDDPEDENATTILSLEDIPLIQVVKDSLLQSEHLLDLTEEYGVAVYRNNIRVEPSVLSYAAPLLEIPNRFTRALYHLVLFKHDDVIMDEDAVLRILNMNLVTEST